MLLNGTFFYWGTYLVEFKDFPFGSEVKEYAYYVGDAG